MQLNDRCIARFSLVEKRIEELLKESDEHTQLIVAIDGRCAGGKTTLGYYLQEQFDCNLFLLFFNFSPICINI